VTGTLPRGQSPKPDAKVLADLVRTDRHNHRLIAADSELLAAIKVFTAQPPKPDLDPTAPSQPAGAIHLSPPSPVTTQSVRGLRGRMWSCPGLVDI
jgi:hypothetical protein